MSKFRLEFKLKQHTPLIHFQHDQSGATLRATELKPKLDKFILMKIGRENDPSLTDYKEQYKLGEKEAKRRNWLIGKDDYNALDFMVKIFSDSAKIDGIRNNKTYFGGIGHQGEKEYTWTANPIKISIIVFNDELKTYIKNYFPYFLAETNFGTRQNKGNGSFYLHPTDTENYRPIENILPNKSFYIDINTLDNNEIFSIIDYYYRRLKAGINTNFDNRCTGEYKKSYLYQYYNSLTSQGWEKRFIKESFFGLYADGIDKYFIRALLGLPGSFMYKKTKEPCHKNYDTNISASYEILDDYEIEVYNPEIERFKSPITFKPIKYADKTKIFIIPSKKEVLPTAMKFILYKKFIVKELNRINGRYQTKPKPLPTRQGTNRSTIETILHNLNTQERNLNDYIRSIGQIADRNLKRRLEKSVNYYIVGQKSRFKNYLEDCQEENGKYFPPKEEIEIPNDNLDLNDLIKKYNYEELNRSFNVGNVSANIEVTTNGK